MFAADMGTGEVQVVAQEVAQEQPWLDLSTVGRAVDLDLDGMKMRHQTALSKAVVKALSVRTLQR